MTGKAYERYKLLEKTLETDGEFLDMESRREELTPQFLAVLNTLPGEQREVLTEYFGICHEMGCRIAELACFLP